MAIPKLLVMLLVACVCQSSDPSVLPVLRKCCPEWHFVTENDTCIAHGDLPKNVVVWPQEYPEPLHSHAGQLQVGFPVFDWNETNFVDDYCIDKQLTVTLNNTFNETVIAKSTDTADHLALLLTIRKCCPRGMAYDKVLHGCVNTTIPLIDVVRKFYGNETRFVNVEYGLKECNKALVEYDVEEYQLSLVGDDLFAWPKWSGVKELVVKDDYCVDATTDKSYFAKVCRDKKATCREWTCISKCCPDGHVLYNEGVPPAKCRPIYDVEFQPTIKKIKNGSHNEYLLDPIDRLAVLPNVVCPNGKYKLNPKEKMDEHYLARNGSLIIIEPFEIHNQHHYCLENLHQVFNGTVNDYGLRTFVCFPGDANWDAIAKMETDRLRWYGLGTLMSVGFLLMTLLVYLCLPELRNLHGKTLMCHTTCLLLAYLILAILQLKVLTPSYCTYLGFFILFMFLASFSWLNIMCFDIWWTFGATRPFGSVRRKTEWKRFGWYNLYAWGEATLVTGAALIAQTTTILPNSLRPGIGQERCFFAKIGEHYGIFLFFIIPVALQIICNVILFILTAHHCTRVKAEIHRMQMDSKGPIRKKRFQNDKAKLVMNIKLFIVMGITWVHEIFSTIFPDPHWFWIIGDSFNVFIGLAIFCIFVMKPKVWRLLRQRLGIKINARPKSHSTATTTCVDPYRIRKSLSVSSTTLTTTTNVLSSQPNMDSIK